MDSPNSRRRLALLAEDDRDIRQVLAGFLEELGYDVISAADGSDMLDALAASLAKGAQPIDVVITDIQMPGMNGLSVIEELRADGWQQPIVVISAFREEAMLSRIRALPRVAFVAKPFDPAQFANTLERLVTDGVAPAPAPRE